MKIQAKKRFGQNFLKDETILEKIIQSMPKNDNVIVEIGPGLGDLTKRLITKKDVIAFEIDKDLCNILKKDFEKAIKEKKLILKCGDVQDHWKNSLVDRPYDLIANLPYYVATNIVLNALRDKNCKNILVMLQKEVAQKFSAESKEKDFSSLSVLAQTAGVVKKLFDIKPEAFEPAPKVMSSILLINKKKSLDDKNFENFLKIAFSAPRKTLLKNLSSKYSKDNLKKVFEQLNILPNIRPHQATTSIYHQLYEILEKRKVDGRKETTKL
ncbi:16S rRNA (adenine(1518)-N(6)/adenine(1519)-N(6))-dimethyltransferase RsmA [Nitrosophilus kaiyonis]|uniref:16S rRNA (adenine(1518)-N(6)/adenine(1519)-N(6))- dimethyltransferase RsmA n=1 Tax=Nitrosophilus kaiyonis TaxID=2930200 RepID=UPI002492EADC|nr:16S rRNA (adenine(1518)-N(6)/adenine(1519)-N(6))-dimethyltransferase RsmA [Nitrosophilus kaiyonis]